MSRDDAHLLFILAAYAVPVLLLAIEIWQLARRSRAQAQSSAELRDEA
jgi:heme exporter protein CcmD